MLASYVYGFLSLGSKYFTSINFRENEKECEITMDVWQVARLARFFHFERAENFTAAWKIRHLKAGTYDVWFSLKPCFKIIIQIFLWP